MDLIKRLLQLYLLKYVYNETIHFWFLFFFTKQYCSIEFFLRDVMVATERVYEKTCNSIIISFELAESEVVQQNLRKCLTVTQSKRNTVRAFTP